MSFMQTMVVDVDMPTIMITVMIMTK